MSKWIHKARSCRVSGTKELNVCSCAQNHAARERFKRSEFCYLERIAIYCCVFAIRYNVSSFAPSDLLADLSFIPPCGHSLLWSSSSAHCPTANTNECMKDPYCSRIVEQYFLLLGTFYVPRHGSECSQLQTRMAGNIWSRVSNVVFIAERTQIGLTRWRIMAV